MKLELKVPNMACSACGEAITKAIQAIDPAAKVEADPKTKLVSVETQASEAVVTEAITSAGYSITSH